MILRVVLSVTAGLLAGLLLAMWWFSGGPRTIAQPSDRLVAWIEITSTEQLPVDAGGTTWILGTTLHLRNIASTAAAVSVPGQRFLVVLDNGSTITGHLAEPVTVEIAPQQLASVPLPRVSFFSRTQDVTNAILALDDGEGLRLVAAPVGKAPEHAATAKPKAAEPAKP